MSDSRLKIGPGWQKLPHYYDALNEAHSIVHVLWKHPKYGRSRDVNGHGVEYKGMPRPMDVFVSYQHAIAAVTKIILRDRYGEVPESANVDEIRRIGRRGRKPMRRDSFGAVNALKW